MNENQPKPIVVNAKAKQLISQRESKQLFVFNTSATNALYGKQTFRGKTDITNESVFECAKGQVFLFIKDYEKQTKKFDSTTLKFLIYGIHLFTKQNSLVQDIKQIKRQVRFKVRDYQQKRGLKNYKETRKQLINDANLLYDVSLRSDNTKVRDGRKHKSAKIKIRILSSEIEIHNGDVIVSFASEFAENLVECGHLMCVSEDCLSMKPVVFEIYSKLYTHARINQNKKKKKRKRKSYEIEIINIISIKFLLEAINDIPSYEDVIKDRHVQRRIIEPLEKGLDELLNSEYLLEWKFCNAKGKPLTREQVEGLNRWDNFIKIYIKYKLPPEPKKKHVHIIETTLVSSTDDLQLNNAIA
jgi:hypothetical protein